MSVGSSGLCYTSPIIPDEENNYLEKLPVSGGLKAALGVIASASSEKTSRKRPRAYEYQPNQRPLRIEHFGQTLPQALSNQPAKVLKLNASVIERDFSDLSLVNSNAEPKGKEEQPKQPFNEPSDDDDFPIG